MALVELFGPCTALVLAATSGLLAQEPPGGIARAYLAEVVRVPDSRIAIGLNVAVERLAAVTVRVADAVNERRLRILVQARAGSPEVMAAVRREVESSDPYSRRELMQLLGTSTMPRIGRWLGSRGAWWRSWGMTWLPSNLRR